MIDRKLRYTMSAVAWVGVFLWALALFGAATATATNQAAGHENVSADSPHAAEK